jgi:hypothetical protein
MPKIKFRGETQSGDAICFAIGRPNYELAGVQIADALRRSVRHTNRDCAIFKLADGDYKRGAGF